MFNKTEICTKSTGIVLDSCTSAITHVKDNVVPIEATVLAVGSILVLWQIAFQIQTYRQTTRMHVRDYELVRTDSTESADLQVQPARTRTDRNYSICMRVNSVVLTIGLLLILGQFAAVYEMTRRSATDENCAAITAFAKRVCEQILDNTYHSVIPGS